MDLIEGEDDDDDDDDDVEGLAGAKSHLFSGNSFSFFSLTLSSEGKGKFFLATEDEGDPKETSLGRKTCSSFEMVDDDNENEYRSLTSLRGITLICDVEVNVDGEDDDETRTWVDVEFWVRSRGKVEGGNDKEDENEGDNDVFSQGEGRTWVAVEVLWVRSRGKVEG